MSTRARFTWVFIAVVGTIGSLYGSYMIGVWSGHAQYADDKTKIAQLKRDIEAVTAQLRTAEDGLIFADRQKQIQEEAYKQLSQAYSNSEEKNQVLGTTLDFYRSIISPEDGQSGPAIHAFKHFSGDQAFRFDVTLVQAIKHKVQIRGQLRVKLFSGDEMLGQWPQSAPRSVSYQYFVKVSGEIPLANEPSIATSQLRVEVSLDLGDGESLERTFNIDSQVSEE